MSQVFKKLKDQTPKSVGQEVGEVLSVSMAEIKASNEQMNAMLAKTIADALARLEPKADGSTKKDVKTWTFRVERNDKGLMTQVIATAT